MQHGWTLEKQKWDYLLAVVSGTCWSKTTLDELYCDDVPKCTGVYAICVTIPNFNQHVCLKFYIISFMLVEQTQAPFMADFFTTVVGQSEELNKRKNVSVITLNIGTPKMNPDRVKELEARLIECFGPPANRISGQKHPRARLRQPRPCLMIVQPFKSNGGLSLMMRLYPALCSQMGSLALLCHCQNECP